MKPSPFRPQPHPQPAVRPSVTGPSTAVALAGLDKDGVDGARTSPDVELAGVFDPAAGRKPAMQGWANRRLKMRGFFP